jgi:CRISPR-associated protein (TIGR03986 family)
MSVRFSRGPGWAVRDGDTLTGELSYRADGKKPARRRWQRAQLDPALAGWLDAARDGDQVEVYAEVDGDGQLVRVRMANPPAVTRPGSSPERLAAVRQLGGGVNPYTFIPAPPRDGLPPGLADAEPAPHGVIDAAAQWSGWLVLRVVVRTPLLLPDPEAVTRGANQHPTYPVRLGPDGMPLLHGASVKGALRSAYETVSGSRYGVFRGHQRALAYRRAASDEDRPEVTPARVQADGDGGLCFRPCKALPVPLYDPPPARRGQRVAPPAKVRAVGAAKAEITRADGTLDWARLHRREVGYTTRTTGRAGGSGAAGRPGGSARTVVDTVTLPSPLPSGAPATASSPAGSPAGSPGGAVRRGWLSITRRSIENKTSERLFVPTGEPAIPVDEVHHVLWHAVLSSYHDAAQHNEPGLDAAGRPLARSRHVTVDGEVPARLVPGDLVYLDLDKRTRRVAAVHPVMIGRLPYGRPPSGLLDESLHPAAEPGELSAADRLFGWAPAAVGPGRPAASGYRGRLRVASVRCQTPDWRTDHGPDGAKLAPLSSPKPTQFRFYAAADQVGGPVGQGVPKAAGYPPGGGLRGRKAYWYPNAVPDGYWTPGDGQVGGGFREWQAPPDAKPSQTSTHLGWVREGTEFAVRLFVDAVPGVELAPLLWLAMQDGCPLRLGAGKPLGFGAVQVGIDWQLTELRTGDALRGCWLALTRPPPCPREQIEALAAGFEQVATHPVLAPAVAAWRKVAQGLAAPACYPRTQPEPEAETYRWFVANERVEDRKVRHGFALPHVLEDDQRLPFLPPADR